MNLITPEMGMVFWIAISIVLIVFPLLALYSVLKSTFKDGMTKFIWALVILIVPVIGSAFYFLVGRNQRLEII